MGKSVHCQTMGARETGEDKLPDTVFLELTTRGGRTDHVVSALRDDNPNGDLKVADHGDRIQVHSRQILMITRQSLQWHLGPDFAISDLETMITAHAGVIDRSCDHLVVRSTRPGRATQQPSAAKALPRWLRPLWMTSERPLTQSVPTRSVS